MSKKDGGKGISITLILKVIAAIATAIAGAIGASCTTI